jgi:hypothetical protein
MNPFFEKKNHSFCQCRKWPWATGYLHELVVSVLLLHPALISPNYCYNTLSFVDDMPIEWATENSWVGEILAIGIQQVCMYSWRTNSHKYILAEYQY